MNAPSVKRQRPMMVNGDAPLPLENGGGGGDPFPSGYTSVELVRLLHYRTS